MRQIKFRAWHKKKKEMYRVMTIDFELGRFNVTWQNFRPTDMGLRYGHSGWNEENCELMQYTGLKDKNGKEIYEGDILEDSKKQRGQVFWHNASFRIEWLMRQNDGTRYVEEIDSCFGYGTVIGNIYENPKLLVKT